MYGLLLLRLKQQPVSEGTQVAAAKISEWLRILAIKHKQDREKGLED
jgi:hypothetical protein